MLFDCKGRNDTEKDLALLPSGLVHALQWLWLRVSALEVGALLPLLQHLLLLQLLELLVLLLTGVELVPSAVAEPFSDCLAALPREVAAVLYLLIPLVKVAGAPARLLGGFEKNPNQKMLY